EQFVVFIALELGDELILDLRSIFARLVAHSPQELGTLDAVGKAGDVTGAWNPAGTALARIYDQNFEVEASEIDRCGQPCRPPAHDQAIEDRFVHPVPMDCRTGGSRLARRNELDLRADRLRTCGIYGCRVGVVACDPAASVERPAPNPDGGVNPAGNHSDRNAARNPVHLDHRTWSRRKDRGSGDRRDGNDRWRLHHARTRWRSNWRCAGRTEAAPLMFRATVLALYPDMFPGPLVASLAGRALEDGLWSLEATNIRDFATDKHRSVDDTPAGGGSGMVLRPDV